MAIDFLEGEPGGGKSYTAVERFIMPALKNGRAVVTDIPLVIPELNRRLKMDCEPLIYNLRESELERRPFSDLADFDPGWSRQATNAKGEVMRHPETKEPLIERPLCVIDEAHEVWPATGAKQLSLEWDSFFGKHRHYGLDLVLLTQDAGYVHVSIRKRMRMRHRLVNMAFFGLARSFFIQTFRGYQSKTVLNRSFGRYRKKIFACYVSHTGGGASSAPKTKPVWLNWKTIMLFGTLALLLYKCSAGDMMTVPGAHKTASAPGGSVQAGQGGQGFGSYPAAPPTAEALALAQTAATLRAQADLELAIRELARVKNSVCADDDGASPERSGSGVVGVSVGGPDPTETATPDRIPCRLVPAPPDPPRHMFAGSFVKVATTLQIGNAPPEVWFVMRRGGVNTRIRGRSLRELGWYIHYYNPCRVLLVSAQWRGIIDCRGIFVPR